MMCSGVRVVKGTNNHHWSYKTEHAYDVINLSILQHAKLHRHLKYDQQFFCYRRKDTNELLDTKEKHLAFYHLIKNNT